MTTKGCSAVGQRLERGMTSLALACKSCGAEVRPGAGVAVFAEYQDRAHCCEFPLSDRLLWAFFGLRYCSSPIGLGKRCTPLDDH